MKCPFCRSNQTEVYNTRTTKTGAQLWRRRRCLDCHEAFTTYEAPDLRNILQVSQNDTHKPYSRARLYAAIVGVLEHDSGAADALTDTIEAKILDLRARTVSSDQVSNVVLSTLKAYDTAAFLRYLASHADLRSRSELKRQLKNY